MPKGLDISRFFTDENTNPFDTVEWDTRTAQIKNDKGDVIFERKDVVAPETWSQLAVDICASKYFHEYEFSIKDMIRRVVNGITETGRKNGYFKSNRDEQIFYEELCWLILHQYASFNSPVWFNVGVRDDPQCSACFIQPVEDNMESIMDLATKEARLFKQGSGTGTDLSPLRSEKEKLSGGGSPSGPLSFLKIYNSVADVVKSGGKTRRAAKLNVLDVDHPDIKEFIFAKRDEERKAKSLVEVGYDGGINGEAYNTVAYQNANLSVKIPNQFMDDLLSNNKVARTTNFVTDGSDGPAYNAKDTFKWIAEAAWECGDPGIQFTDTINKYNTCKNSGTINCSNPCSEYVFLDNSACNLASINLIKFLTDKGYFKIDSFNKTVEMLTIAMDIIVDMASYPTKEIEENSKKFRPLGLGYANLGALLMSMGLPYDSKEGRDMASAVTALMHFMAGHTSYLLADNLGTFDEWEENRASFAQVWKHQRESLSDWMRDVKDVPKSLFAVAETLAYDIPIDFRMRNAQITLVAPTGTIGFMMDCDTTGIEPDIALVKYKKMVGDGFVKYTNNSIERALHSLNYDPVDIKSIIGRIETNGTIEGSHVLKDGHLPVFDCAFAPKNGSRSIDPMGHLKMMSAVQPFLSGAISKTVNMPEESTVEDIERIYKEAWSLGIKAVSVYRDGCKASQPLQTSKDEEKKETKPCPPQRKRLPTTRRSITHKFNIGGHEGYFTVGLFKDDTPGELFITMAKEGSTIGGLMDSFGTAVSLGLQYGVPIETCINKFVHSRFEPSGMTGDPEIPIAKSIIDYIFRWFEKRFVDDGPFSKKEEKEVDKGNEPSYYTKDAPSCPVCGSITIRNGTCYKCEVCGNSLGCS